MEEDLLLGGSSAINIAGAVRLARPRIRVTILCDSSQRYQSKIWNPAFLAEKKLPDSMINIEDALSLHGQDNVVFANAEFSPAGCQD